MLSIATGHDTRGRIWNNARSGGVLFSTMAAPNSKTVNDRVNHCQSITSAPCEAASGTDLLVLARSRHTSGVNVGMADGSVRFVSDNVDVTAWQGAGSRAGGAVCAASGAARQASQSDTVAPGAFAECVTRTPC